MSFRHGKSGSAKVAAEVLKVLQWSVKDAADLEESSNTASNGKKQWTAGFNGLDWTIEAQWEATKGPFDVPVLVPGTEISTLFLGVNGSVNGYAMPTAIVESADITMATKNVIKWSISGHSQGDFTRPSDTA